MSSFEENYRFLNSKKNRKIMLFFLLKIDLFLFFFENLIGYNKGGLSEIYSQVFMCVCVFLLCVCVYVDYFNIICKKDKYIIKIMDKFF